MAGTSANNGRITIVGAGVAGLTLACILARSGRQVRIFERAQHLGGKASVSRVNGFTFDEGPSIVVMRSVYEDLFKRLQLNIDDYIKFERLDPAYRINGINGERFDIHADFESTLDSVHSSLGRDAAHGLNSLMKRLDKYAHAVGLAFADRAYRTPFDLARWSLVRSGTIISPFQSYDSIVQEHVAHPLLREFLSGFPGYAGYHPARAPGGLLYLPWTLLREGVFHPVGGVGEIPAALARIAREAGVEINVGADVDRIDGDASLARFISVGGKLEAIAANETVVFNGDLTVLANDLAPDAFETSERNTYRSQSPSFFTLQWEIPKQLSRELELKHHNLYLPGTEAASYRDVFEPGRSYPEFPPLYVNAPSVSDSTLAPADAENLFMVISVPSHQASAAPTQEYLEQYARKCIENLRRFDKRFPAEPKGVFRVRGSTQFELELKQRGGQIYGPDVHTSGTLGGLFRPHPVTPKWKNLLLVGGSTQPGAGLPLAVQSGKIVANLIQGSAKP